MSTDGEEATASTMHLAPPGLTINDSNAAVATTCHVEDVTQPCTNPNCGVHTSANTPAPSRAVSHANLAALMQHAMANSSSHDDVSKSNAEGDSNTGVTAGEEETAAGLLDTADEPAAGLPDHTTADVAPSQDFALQPSTPSLTPSSPPTPPPAHSVVVEDVDSVSAKGETLETPSNGLATQITPSTTPSPQPEEQQNQQEAQDSINWDFDDPEALQEHVVGGPDPFAQLHAEAPARSASFPPVPPPAQPQPQPQPEPDEQSLMNMMASEVMAGEGERGMFDSPTVVQGGFFADHEAPAEDDFFAQASRQDSIPEQPIGNPNAMGLYGQDTMQQRYEEGLPLVHDPELVVESKKEYFFGSEPDSPMEQDVFAGIDEVAMEPAFGAPQRKSTEQILAGMSPPQPSDGAVREETGTVPEEPEEQEVEKPPSPSALFSEPTPAGDDDFFGQLGQKSASVNDSQPEAPKDDIAAKWQAALADDEFLDDDDGFLPSDDEGFLPDDEPDSQPTAAAGGALAPQRSTATEARYMPQQQQSQQQWSQQPPSNSYTPQGSGYTLAAPPPTLRHTQSSYFPAPATSPYAQAFGAVPAQPEVKPQSFVDKSEGYKSPYDLPIDLSTTIKRRQNPVQNQGMNPAFPPPGGVAPPTGPAKPMLVAPQKQQFFEELPMAPPKTRPVAAQGRYAPPPQAQIMTRQGSAGGLQYAPPPPPAPTNRYSPAVPKGQGFAPPPAPATPSADYAPAPAPLLPPAPVQSAPPAPVQSAPPVATGKYAPRPAGPPQQPARPQPARVSSSSYVPPPVAQPQSQPSQSQPASPYTPPPVAQPRLQPAYTPSSGPTPMSPPSVSSMSPPSGSLGGQHSPEGLRRLPATSTPPPQNIAQRQFSPQKQVRPASPVAFQPPPRAQTSSPGLHYGRPKAVQKPRDPYERPSSALAHSMIPEDFTPEPQQRYSLPLEQRKDSMQLNFMPPNDYTAQDVLCRWQGAPVFTWGLGGSVTTMFPIRTNRFSSDLHSTVIKCSPGEVKTRPLKDVLSLPEHVEKFPGPMWTGTKSANKAKKKEVMTYMDSRIEGMEKTLMEIYDPNERRVAEEKCMLWKIVRIMVENDGAVEGTPEIDAAVRKILIPEVAQSTTSGEDAGFVPMNMGGAISAMRPANAETVDAEALSEFRMKLLSGDREAAVWFAADKRLWAHALLIASTVVGKDLWKRVIEEFVKNEVKTLGEGSESLAMLYATLAGNWEESVNELVPLSARTGVPMLSSTQEERSVEDRLAKWRESLALILSNRSAGDQTSILALGRLLAGYGWTAAAHICFIFARQGPLGGGGACFGGPEDPTTDFCLLSVDHRNKSELGRDLDSIILSEIYELAVSLAPHASTATPIFPHLQLWKVHHAIVLAENGNKAAAQKYCDAVAAAVKAWNKPNPYFNQTFGHVLEDFTKRLQEAPRDSSSSGANGSGWIPKLTSDAMSSSMWGAFNKFVSGEEEVQHGANGLQPEAGGPFGKITPSVSRVQSSADLYGAAYGTPMYSPPNHTPGGSPSANRATMAPNRYAPSTGTARSSMEGARPNIYEPSGRRASGDSYRGYEPSGNPYEAHVQAPYKTPYGSYDPSSNPYGSPPSNPYGSPPSAPNPYAPRASLEATPEVPEQSNTPANSGYSPYSPPNENGYQPSTAGYEPPSGGYAPPTDDFVPYQPEAQSDDEKSDEAPKPKKKSMLDDDDDDELLKRAEAVKKAAEEEAKRKAAAEKSKESEAGGAKKGWFGGWFGRKDPSEQQQGPIKAKLGEESSFVYDSELKRWVNKKAGAAAPEPPKPAGPPRRVAAPTPPASAPPVTSPPMASTAPPPMSATPQPAGLAPPPLGLPPRMTPSPAPSTDGGAGSSRPPTAMGSRPPTAMGSRPSTAAAGDDIMDQLLGPPTAKRGAARKGGRKGGASRYVEVIPGQK